MDYIPDLTQLPTCVLRLASDVEWNVEKDCFDTLCRVLARFYRKPNNSEVSLESPDLMRLFSQLSTTNQFYFVLEEAEYRLG